MIICEARVYSRSMTPRPTPTGFCGVWKDGLFVSSRSETVFFKLVGFIEIVDGYDKHVSRRITAHINHFEIAWCASRHDGDLPSGFHAEQDKEMIGPFQLYQIRVGPGNPPSYRAWVMFLNEGTDAYWVYT